MALVWAAEKSQWEVCLKLAELGADLNLADQVSEACCNCISDCCNIIVTLTFSFFELVWRHDGLNFGCCGGSVGSVCETGRARSRS